MAYKEHAPIITKEGGTGNSSWTANAPVVAGSTSTAALAQVTGNLNTAGYVLTANGSGAPTFQAAAAGGIVTINGDSGSVTGSTVTITGSTSGAVFTGSGSTLTESFNYLALPTTTSTNGQIKINGTRALHAYGTQNMYGGLSSGNFTQTGTDNAGFGFNVLTLISSGQSNVAIGSRALQAATTDSNNTGIGQGALLDLKASGGNNVAIGASSGTGIVTGSYNIIIGVNAGSSYFSSESHNIIVNADGTPTESNVLRLGAGTGTGTRQINKSVISGIRGITTGNNDALPVYIDSSGQLGTAGNPNAGTLTLTYTPTSASTYVVLTTDQYIGVDCSGGAKQVNLPNAPATGRVFTIKDKTGSAGTNAITLTTVGGVVNIDGATTFVMNTAYESHDVIFNGSSYEIW